MSASAPEAAGDAGSAGTPDPAAAAADRRRWLVLAVIATAQLMVVLDGTVVNIALPSAQNALHFSNADRQWIITGYALAFGSLLLLGGKLGDLFGRKPVFITGLVGFAAASALGGAANGFGLLVAARVCQGLFGALLSPAGLSLLTTTFPDAKDRGKAFGLYGGIVGSGGAVGLLLGGVLTEYLSWRWCLFINLVFAAAGLVGAISLLRHERPTVRPRLDLPGSLAVSAAMFALVYGCSNADTHGWHAPSTWGSLAIGAVLLIAFVLRQSRVAYPLLPLRILADRNRAGAYTAIFLVMSGAAGVFLFLTYYLQETLHYSAVGTGVAYLPMLVAALGLAITSNVVLLPRLGPRRLVVAGMLIGACGMAWLTRIGLNSEYFANLLGPLLLTGSGMGLTLSPSMNTATYRLPPGDAGVGSALANTQQQVGQSIGTALLNTVAVSASAHYFVAHAVAPGTNTLATDLALDAIHGYTTAFWWAAGIFAVGAVLCGAVLRSGPLDRGPASDAHGAPAARSSEAGSAVGAA